VLAQDMANLPRVQAGLKSTGKRTVSFGSYQEGRLRMFHRTIDQFVPTVWPATDGPDRWSSPFLVPAG
jgi:hypothetical protein